MKNNLHSAKSVLIVDPHDIFVAGFSNMIHKFSFIRDVAAAQNLGELSALIRNSKFHIALVDAGFCISNKNCIRQMNKRFPEMHIIGMSMLNDPSEVSFMMSENVNSFILKTIKRNDLSDAFQSVLNGKSYLSVEVQEKLKDFIWNKAISGEQLRIHNQRIREMLFLICNELTSKEIAFRMKISEKTVEKYRKRLLDATGSKNVVGLALYAIQNNIDSDMSLRKKYEKTLK